MSDTDQPGMSSTRPYLLRAIYDWLVDNGATPHLLVDASVDGTVVPQQHVENGMIVLNVAPTAVRELELGNEYIMFGARFSGVHFDITVPLPAIQAIYGRENGQGIFLGEIAGEEVAPATTITGSETAVTEALTDQSPAASESSRKPGKGPHLTLVK